MDSQSLRNLQNLRTFIKSLVEQTEKSELCECHRPPSFLLVGPPGAGKTYLVKQMSTVCEVPLFGVHTHHLNGAFSMRNLFDQARELDYPSLLFLDDIDVLFTDQESPGDEPPLLQGLRTELFAQLGPRKLKIFDPDSNKNPVQHDLLIPQKDGEQTRLGSPNQPRSSSENNSPFPDNSGLIVIAATSAPWLLFKDHELLSRFRGVYMVGLPDKDARYEILKTLLQKIQHNLTDKDFWTLAERTEGYTPSDLMILTKSLNYKQFEFLFALGGANESDEESTEEEGTISSSELSETETESDEQDDVVLQLNTKILSGMQERPIMTPIPTHSSPLKSSSGCSSPSRQDTMLRGENESNTVSNLAKSLKLNNKFVTNMSMLAADWNSDAETSKNDISERSPFVDAESKDVETGSDKDSFDTCDPRTTCLEVDTSSPDSALGRSKSSEEDIESTKKISTSMDESLTPTTEETSGGSAIWHKGGHSPSEWNKGGHVSPSDGMKEALSIDSFACDNSLSAINPNVSQVDAKMKDRSVEEVEVVMETLELRVSSNSIDAAVSSATEMADKSAKSDSSFLNNSDDVREFKLKIQEPPDPMQNDNKAIDSDRDSDNEMSMRTPPRNRRVNFSSMAPMEPLTIDVDSLDDDRVSGFCRYRNRSPPPPPPDAAHDETDRVSTNNILRSLLSRSASVSYRGDTSHIEALRNKREENDYGIGCQGSADLGLGDDSNERRRSCPDLDRSLFNDDDDTVGLKALLGASLSRKNKSSTPEPMDQLNQTPNSITPPMSRGSSHSVASSGSGARMPVVSSESDNAQKQDSDSSVGRETNSITNDSSDISTVTCNETGETLECHSDAEERFRNLREDLNEPPQASSASEDEAIVKKKPPIYGNLNLDNLGEISIQILTLSDVMEVVEKTPRSVSEEETSRYAQFMAWFQKVAKSACPHTKQEGKDKSQLDDMSLASTMSCATTSRKRKKPLKKVGRFLLKALMFILD